MTDAQWRALAGELRRAVTRVVPSWTESTPHDPGVAIVELLAFLSEEIRQRGGVGDDGAGLRRVAYFAGKLLDAEDFQAEQDYVIERLNRRNRLLHGPGIVAGLEVTLDGDAGRTDLVIGPGLAFDRRGREICLVGPCRRPLPASGAALFVHLTYCERACRPVPAIADAPAATRTTRPTRPSRILETFQATLDEAPDDEAVAVGRVHRVRNRWRVDARFKAEQARR